MATPSRSKATPARIAIAERECAALELRKAGKTFDEIARALGYSERGGAAKAVGRALDATIRERADELRKLEAERLDALTAALWPRAMDGDLKSVDRVLSIMERRAKLLGLDAPSRRAVEVVTREAFEKIMGDLEAEFQDLDSRLAEHGIAADGG
jgi:predicted transcriptional regulator